MNPNELVKQFLASSQASQSKLGEGQKQLETANAQIGALGQQQQTAGQVYIDSAAEAARSQAAAEYATAIVHQQAQAAAGLNPDDVNNEINKSTAAINAARSERLMLQNEWKHLQQVDFMSNPIGYILSQLKADDVARKHNAALITEEDEYANVAQRTQLLQSVKSTVTANTADTLAETNIAKAKAAVAQARMKLYEAQESTVSKQAGLWMQQLDLALRSEGIARENVRFAQDVQNAAEARIERAEARAYRRAQEEDRRKDIKLKEAAIAEYEARLKAVGDMIGRPGLNIQSLKDVKDNKLKTEIATAADTLTFGNSLGESVLLVAQAGSTINMRNSGNAGAAALVEGAHESIVKRANQLIKQIPKPGEAKLKPTEAVKKAEEGYQEELESSVKVPNYAKPVNSPLWDTEFNPLRAPHSVVLDVVGSGKMPELKNNVALQAAQTISQTRTTQGDFTGADETRIFTTVAEQVAGGKLSPNVAAAQLKQYFDAGAVVGLQHYQYDRFALPAPKNYYMAIPMRVPRYGALGSAATIDSGEANIPAALGWVIPVTNAISMTNKEVAVDMRNVTSIERGLKAYVLGAKGQAAWQAATK